MDIDKTYSTPYDDVFKTLLTKLAQLVIPLINEIFGEEYTGDEEIILSPSEYYVSVADGTDKKIALDSSLIILAGIPKRYHLECQSDTDNTILIRIFEYDIQVALGDGVLEGTQLTIRIPNSAILYLRNTGTTPPVQTIRIETPEGHTQYSVQSLMVREYSIEEIFSKNLLFLIPFHIFSYEKRFKEINSSEDQCEELYAHFSSIRERLDEMQDDGAITEYDKRILIELSQKVISQLAIKYDNVKKAGDFMGGQVLELETDKWYAGFKEGQLDKDNAVKASHESGRAEEHAQLAGVNLYLLDQKRYDDLAKVNKDEDYYQTILNEMKDAGLFVSETVTDF